MDEAPLQRRDHAAGLLDLPEQVPCSGAQLSRQRFEAAGARGRVGDLGEVGFLQQDELGVAGDPPGGAVRQDDGGGMRQHRDAVGAAEAGRNRRHCGAQNIYEGIAPRQHAPRGLGRDEHRRWTEAAGLLDARPKLAQRAEFRRGEELVGIGGQAEINHAARVGERHAGGFERAQIGERRRQHVGQLQNFRPAGVVDDASVRDRERAGIACNRQLPNGRCERSRLAGPGRRLRFAARQRPDGIEAEPNDKALGTEPAPPYHVGDAARHLRHGQPRIEVERDPGIEIDAVEYGRDRVHAAERKATRSGRTFKYQRQPVRTVLQVVQRLGVGG